MLRELSDCVEGAGRGDGKDVSELLVQIQVAVNDCQVSSKIVDQRYKLLMGADSHSCIHHTWRITSAATEGLFRT